MNSLRDVLHVDMDAFFASVERVLDPSLEGKPVIVGGDMGERSVVSAASYEARRFGVRSAMPMAQARRLCPQGVFLRGHSDAYAEFSYRVREILLRFTPLVEAVSLDDFYLDLTGCGRLHGTPFAAAELIRESILRETRLTVSIGVSVNRMVAKVASERAKPNGILWIRPGCEAAFLRALPVEDLPGIGPSTAALLHKFNLTTLGDVAALSPDHLTRLLGDWGMELWERASGRDDAPVTPDHGPPKSIGREQTFAEDTLDADQVRAVLYALTERAARQLRAEGLLARRVTVKVRFADFQTATAARSLRDPVDLDPILYEAAVDRLGHLMLRKMRVRLVGVSLSGLTPRENRQGGLFPSDAQGKRDRFYRGLDRLRERFGFDIAAVGPALKLQDKERA